MPQPRTIDAVLPDALEGAAPQISTPSTSIPTPRPGETPPRLEHVNAVTGQLIAQLVNQVAMSQAYIDALLEAHAAKDRQIEALRSARMANGSAT